VTDRRAFAAGEHAGQPAAIASQLGVPRGVHAAVDGDEPQRANAARDHLPREPGVEQLTSAHDAVLGRGKPCDHSIREGWVVLIPHTTHKRAQRVTFAPSDIIRGV
jgi:hypothetical protein